MSTISSFCKELKSNRISKKARLDKPVAFWSEPDRFNDEKVNAFVIILKTKGCSWAQKSGCSMCGYYNESAHTTVPDQDLISQYNLAMQTYRNEPIVKIFTSGSFFDSQEISKTVRNYIFLDLAQKTKKTSIESRPEYVNKEVLDELTDILSTMHLEIGIGLETTNDEIRQNYINKGFTYQDYKNATDLLTTYKHLIKTYLLIKPPFITEKQAIQDTLDSIKSIKEISNSISLNPTNVQKGTLVEYFWKRNYYRPPWLWSILEILKKGRIITNKRIQCDVAGGGTIRGAHNCKNCDKIILSMIRDFSVTQDLADLEINECDCIQQWKDQLELEPLSFGSLIDVQRGLIP